MKKQKTNTDAATGKPTRLNVRSNYSSRKLEDKRFRKRQEAEERQAKYDALTLKEKLATCIPGGSKRQRARLEAAMAKVKTTAVKISPVGTEPAVENKPKRVSKSKVVRAAKSERPSKS